MCVCVCACKVLPSDFPVSIFLSFLHDSEFLKCENYTQRSKRWPTCLRAGRWPAVRDTDPGLPESHVSLCHLIGK